MQAAKTSIQAAPAIMGRAVFPAILREAERESPFVKKKLKPKINPACAESTIAISSKLLWPITKGKNVSENPELMI